MNKCILTISIIFIICGCDPVDTRLKIENLSNESLHVNFLFIGEHDFRGTMAGRIKVNAKETNTVGRLNYWDEDFLSYEYLDSQISVLTYKSHLFNGISEDQYQQLEFKLLSTANYRVKKYSLKELQRLDWKISYPSDGFTKGDSLHLFKEYLDM